MSDDSRLKVVLSWHMHQPNYFDPSTNEYILPWTYLHAIKDYVDMAAHLEAVPEAKAVVNFAPILLEQLDDYAKQVTAFLTEGKVIQDDLLASLTSTDLPQETEQRIELVKACLRANETNMINRFSKYQRLAEIAKQCLDDPEQWLYVNNQYIADIVTWYHLGWIAETVRRQDSRIKALMDKGCNFSLEDRHTLMIVIGELLNGVIERYRRLAENGQVELSFSPYAHPIMPLLLDFKTTHEAMPDAPLPLADGYPGGEVRTEWHIEKGLQTFERYFGFRPQGCWPSEGSMSMQALGLLDKRGIRWAASGESVLRNSLNLEQTSEPLREAQNIHQPYLAEGQTIACFFRDDGLSDAIGFNYSTWHADDAVANLVYSLETIAEQNKDNPGAVVSIILDGENAWEYFPENGYYFLSALYQQLSANPNVQMTTFSACLDQQPPQHTLSHIVPGSWVYGSFSTWIGETDKNRGWDMLVEAKQIFDEVVASGRLTEAQLHQAEHQLSICEGSDWFWWFGDYNPSDAVNDFERLYRLQLMTLYQMLGVAVPEYLFHPFSQGGGNPAAGGVMRHGQEG